MRLLLSSRRSWASSNSGLAFQEACGTVRQNSLPGGYAYQWVTTVLIPKENEKDLKEIPDKVKEGLKIVTIKKIEDAVRWVFDTESRSPSSR